MSRIMIFVGILSLFINSAYPRNNITKVEPRRGMIGIQLGQKDGGFFVHKVFKNSPAEKAGLQTGDVILRVKEQDVSGLSMAQVLNLFNGNPETELQAAVMRGGMEVPPIIIHRMSPKQLSEESPDFKKIVKRPKSPGRKVAPPNQGKVPVKPEPLNSVKIKKWLDYYYEVYGFRAVFLDNSFAEKLGALNNEGLLVIDVNPGTPASKAGLSRWDVIYRIDGTFPVLLFKKSTPPDKSAGALPLDITLMGITGEKEVKL